MRSCSYEQLRGRCPRARLQRPLWVTEASPGTSARQSLTVNDSGGGGGGLGPLGGLGPPGSLGPLGGLGPPGPLGPPRPLGPRASHFTRLPYRGIPQGMWKWGRPPRLPGLAGLKEHFHSGYPYPARGPALPLGSQANPGVHRHP